MATIKVPAGESWKAALRRHKNQRMTRNQIITISLIIGVALGGCSVWGLLSMGG